MRRVFALALVAGALFAPAEARAAESAQTTAAGLGAAQVTSSSLAGTSAAGCRTVDVARIGRSLLGFVVYKFHQVKRWCWDFPRITWKSVWTYVSDVDPNMDYKGVVSAYGYYYTWCCSNGYSGHSSRRVGKFVNCIPYLGCLGTYYPWVRIRAHGDGTYTYTTGD